MATLSSCEKSKGNTQDREVAEAIVLNYLKTRNFTYFSIEESIHDEDENNYAVYTKSLDGTILKKVTVIVEDGKVINLKAEDWDGK